MSSSDDSNDLILEHVKQEPKALVQNLVPEVSKERYLKTYDLFIKWRNEKKKKSLSESVLISYFYELSKKLKPSSLWSIYSMLKATIHTKHDIDMKRYSKLILFLKRQSVGYKCKETKVFTADQIVTFLNEAPDDIYLAAKVCMIFGISGACRTNELTNMTITDIETQGNLLLIKLPHTKTQIDRTFFIRNEYVQFIKKYQDMRPAEMQTNRLFINYNNGRCTRQVMGKNKLASLPKFIAKYLKLPNPELYTGHCFRKTSATLLAKSGANLSTIKQIGGWKTNSVFESLIEEPDKDNTKINREKTETIYLRTSCSSSELRPCPSQDCTSEDLKPRKQRKKEGDQHVQDGQDPLSQHMQQNIDLLSKASYAVRVKSTNTEQNEHRAKIMARGLPEKKPLPGVKSIILVASGKGGVGKTTTAVNLACAMKVIEPDKAIGLLDADVFGPSVPLMMNISGEPMLNDHNLIEPILNYGVKCMSMGLLVSGENAVVWRGLMVMQALERLTRHVAWGPLDCLIIDTPPGTGDTHLSLAQNLPLDGALVVTTPQSAALQVTKRGLNMFEKLKVPVIGMVENMSHAVCQSCGTKNYIFGNETRKTAREMGLEIIESFAVDHNMSECINSGKPAIYALPDSIHAEKYINLANKVFKYIEDKEIEGVKANE